jgi:hypothetical protein
MTTGIDRTEFVELVAFALRHKAKIDLPHKSATDERWLGEAPTMDGLSRFDDTKYLSARTENRYRVFVKNVLRRPLGAQPGT